MTSVRVTDCRWRCSMVSTLVQPTEHRLQPVLIQQLHSRWQDTGTMQQVGRQYAAMMSALAWGYSIEGGCNCESWEQEDSGEGGSRTETKTTDRIGQDNGDQENIATESKRGTWLQTAEQVRDYVGWWDMKSKTEVESQQPNHKGMMQNPYLEGSSRWRNSSQRRREVPSW